MLDLLSGGAAVVIPVTSCYSNYIVDENPGVLFLLLIPTGRLFDCRLTVENIPCEFKKRSYCPVFGNNTFLPLSPELEQSRVQYMHNSQLVPSPPPLSIFSTVYCHSDNKWQLATILLGRSRTDRTGQVACGSVEQEHSRRRRVKV